VDSEIPSPVEGTVVRLVYNEGEIPKVGEVIAIIETFGINGDDKPDNSFITIETEFRQEPIRVPVTPDTGEARTNGESISFISPLIRLLASQRGIKPPELRYIHGTGLEGRITKTDLNTYIANRNGSYPEPTEQPLQNRTGFQEPLPEEGDEMVEMDRMRKLIAANMIRSTRISPHVTSFLEADVTSIVQWREKNKEGFLKAEQVKLTFTPLFVEAVAQALKEYPRINVSVSGENIILRKNINIGIATALPNGNLIVPVIKNTDSENLGSLARKIADLAERSRKNELLPAEIRGGTFTITNIGQYNNLTGTPIINHPESAILAIGTITKKPWAVKTDEGYGIAVRDITMLSLTYDHRVIDGALGGSFLSKIASNLENFNKDQIF
jgi:2-oxoglutarate dehydrogenase E2 component (dihydrolipoamide succinyltransferase)